MAISGEAHRACQGYHDGRIIVTCLGSELSVACFVRFIASLAGNRKSELSSHDARGPLP
jgi:hypothetical protein